MFTGNVLAVVQFEWRRALTTPRMLWWAGLALFPVFIVTMVQLALSKAASQGFHRPPREVFTLLLFGLIPMLVSMLGTFLWTAPAVSAELERQSWVYLAIRPHGGTAVLLGKFVATLAWVLPAALAGLSLAVVIAWWGNHWSVDEAWDVWWTITRLTSLSCPAYAAVYLVIGVLFPKRAMVISFAYTLVFELLVSFVPAVINKLTVQYRLQALLGNWTDLERTIGSDQFGGLALMDSSSSTRHVVILFAYTLGLLIAAIAILRSSEFSTAAGAEM
jgi:ABC-type transport system involved in multi-copper enzyme maturation permease subunit